MDERARRHRDLVSMQLSRAVPTQCAIGSVLAFVLVISVTDTPPNVAVGTVIEKLELAAAAAEAEKATKTTRLLPAPAVHVLVLVADTALTTVVPVPL